MLTISLRYLFNKIYTIIKVVNKPGKEEQFLDAENVCKSKVQSILEIIKTASINIVGIKSTEYIS